MIDNTKITILPEKIGNLKELSYLDISHNKITHLSISFAGLVNLKRFNGAFN